MKELRTLLTLIVLCVCSMHSAWADRMAPELPSAQTLESGTTYYLFNVMEGKFVCRSTTSSSYAALGTYGVKVTITATNNEGEYTIQWAGNGYYWHGNDTYINSGSGSSSNNYFIISESSKGYTIQRSPRNTSYYKADEFVGFDGSNGDRLSPALAEGSIHWQLMSVDDAEYYFAKHKLYTYLETADQYNFYITQYDAIYNNSESTTAELDQAQTALKNALDLSQNYVSPSWTEYPILFQNTTDNMWKLDNNNQRLEWYVYVPYGSSVETTSTLKATVNVDADATMCYTYEGNKYGNLRVYLDGELIQIIDWSQADNRERRYYIEMSAGKHDITWECLFNCASSNGNSYSQYLSGIGVMNTPTIIPATTTVEGQLGTEVLKLVDPVSSVKKIIITGIIGADDWTTIGLMKNAFSIDMSGATATAPMPNYMFSKDNDSWNFLHDLKLPQGLTAIGEYAFYRSDVENEMVFPESLTSIGRYAFQKSKIKAAYMQDGITSVGYCAFNECYYIENATWSASAATIPQSCFSDCYNLRTFTIPEGVSRIDEYAFQNCWPFNPRFPSTLNIIDSYAFENTSTDSLFVDENMTVYYRAFQKCSNLVYAEWPTSFVYAKNTGSTYDTSPVVNNCPKLNKVKLKSPTVVTYDQQTFFTGNNLSNITLLVPDFLESAYKLDPYWYQCNVVGFNSAEQKDWIISNPLVLNEGQRIGGTPNINMQQQSSITINGDTPQAIDNLDICRDWYINSWNTMIMSNTNKVTINGKLTYRSFTPKKKWAFFCLPFDTKVGDIVCESSFAIRYYDGSQRAAMGTGSSWKNYGPDDIIPAGTGFILQTSKQCSTYFTALDNASKQYVVSNNEFVKALDANPSEVTANKGWNLVGNPWLSYYNIHRLNFTAPITVWNGNDTYGKYEAYSIIDDDYAIKPLEAIFVQCPDEVNSISFPIDGRQLTDVIESQSGVRTEQPSQRKLIDVVLSDGEMTDKTRFVLNPQALIDYETTCDASKFMSMDTSVPQIYTIEQNTQMAINERPIGEGTVKIGFKVAADGTYTISAPRNQFKNIVLVDNETGIETDLSTDDYTFQTSAGTYNNRFMLRVGGTSITNINALQKNHETKNVYYNLNGQNITSPQKGLYVVNGKKVVVK